MTSYKKILCRCYKNCETYIYIESAPDILSKKLRKQSHSIFDQINMMQTHTLTHIFRVPITNEQPYVMCAHMYGQAHQKILEAKSNMIDCSVLLKGWEVSDEEICLCFIITLIIFYRKELSSKAWE